MFVVAKLDRLGRDVVDFGTLLKRSERRGRQWYIAVLDQKIDTTTAAGWLMGMQVALFAEYERRLIAERTRDALVIVGRTKQLGRPLSPTTSPAGFGSCTRRVTAHRPSPARSTQTPSPPSAAAPGTTPLSARTSAAQA
jgi:hypothetical protein